MSFTNSKLVAYTKLSPNHSGARKNKIDTITIHHMAGNLTVETCGSVFQNTKRQASSNYGVGTDGRIGLYVDEANRSWASSSAENDNRAVTIEVANCGGAPNWPVSEKAYAALIELLADICRRNGIAKLIWGSSKADRVGHKNGCNMTIHQDFAATVCPGPYLMGKMGEIARDVNAKLGTGTVQTAAAPVSAVPYTVRVTEASLPIRKGPGMTYASTQCIKPGVYTIVEENCGFGRLKSGAGWIALAGVKKV